ncbi:MAG: hypothetical protein M1828_005119 [Chrysothrix sp. TS-e1954]|nr:MAG: hypothetical protein M1828_005119 [Chrysothrix sp. TS-e1954]
MCTPSSIAAIVPKQLLCNIFPAAQEFLKFQKLATQHIEEMKVQAAKDVKDQDTNDSNSSVFRSVLESHAPESELATARLAKEAQVLFAAGTVSTARTLDFITFYILNDSAIRTKLVQELAGLQHSSDSPLSLLELEKLPYLQAIIKEGLRLSYGVMHRLPHCFPDKTIQYKEWIIPAGTPVGMSSYMMHNEASVYERPQVFRPERWLESTNPLMEKYLVPFSRGSRRCLGMHKVLPTQN